MSTILHQWDYLFAFGTIACALDAFNIGANDVANSFATSVASKSLTMRQAALAAGLCEFLGAVLVGAKVAATIKNGIISLSSFEGNAGVQLLAFTCALSVSAGWLMFCTKHSWPVSTTYSIVSALAGVGVAVAGADSVQWGWNGGKGLGTIFAGFIMAPGIAAVFGAILFLFTKYVVLVRKDSIHMALYTSPLYFFLVTAVLTMSIVYKGSPSLNLDELPEPTVVAAIVGTAAVVTALAMLFWLPYVHAKVVKKDYTIRWFHLFYGPMLWKRQAPADAGQIGAAGVSTVPDYRVYNDDEDGTHDPVVSSCEFPASAEIQSAENVKEKDIEGSAESHSLPRAEVPLAAVETKDPSELDPEQDWWSKDNLKVILRYKILGVLTHGMTVDVHSLQTEGTSKAEVTRLEAMHATAKQYSNETEHLYSFLQVLTACTASFAHGANDVANAIGPYSAIYSIWRTGQPLTATTDTPVWILVFGASFLVIGFVLYGYNIMRVLGNRLTLQSPSRGFCMELGAAITVLLASQYGLPVSSTMCITGATLGVALCNGDLRAFNWRGLAWIVTGWVVTVPVVGTIAGCLTAVILYAPHW
ncbi:sodium:inorganic phosphate symporter [Mrakia frigida]|uniref:inorganic phosphate transporter n=1 Tax=Mrakia frigida TaxID=29902 RepID=UPI003FCC0A49